MQTIWNRASTWALLSLLMMAFSLGTNANAQTRNTSKAPAHKVVNKKATAANSKPSKRKAAVVKAKITPRKKLSTSKNAKGSKVRVALRHSQPANSVIRDKSISSAIGSTGANSILRSEVAFVQDLQSSAVLYDKNSDEARPIASISKLMTALIVAESGLSMSQMLRISDEDVDRQRYSRSRLTVGTELSRADMLHLALMSSENRAAHALGRYYPGGMPAFVRAMNDKARSLGMRNTRFVEPTGLSVENVSTPRDLVQLLRATTKHPLIHRYTTDEKYEVALGNGRQLVYNNTNSLVKNADWDIKVSKTGFINEAGECLVMVTRIDNRDVAIVLLNSTGRYSRIGDAVRVRNYVERSTNVALL